MSLGPYYLPRMFTCSILISVYTFPYTAADAACDIISSVVARIQTQHPNEFMEISTKSPTQPFFQHFNILSTPLEKIEYWIYSMEMLEMHTALLSILHQTKI